MFRALKGGWFSIISVVVVSIQELTAVRADLVFSGHVHAYERSEPVDGVRHFVVGHGGNFAPWMQGVLLVVHAAGGANMG